ncbi:MAG: hypothetical protein QG608_2565 [Actinomycetota bacterium]|nr:hypothetical protein [Actinomycetota bacterium]MDQ1294680.1 hypothetical protein [Actinomycetota bacterium]
MNAADGGNAAGRSPTTLLGWFLASRDRHPHAPALRVGDRVWSYSQLDGLARDLADRLTATGPVRRVGLLCRRDAGGLAGYLAALHAGAAVVPLNPENMVDRNRNIVRQAQVDSLIADPADAGHQDALLRALADTGRRIPVVHPLTTEPRPSTRIPVGRSRARRVPQTRGPGVGGPPEEGDLACLLFDSGTTGQPKGVPITHRQVCAHLAARGPEDEVGPGDTVSQIHELTSDLSVFELWTAWAGGACVLPLSRPRDAPTTARVRDLGITVRTATDPTVSCPQHRWARPEKIDSDPEVLPVPDR